LRAYDCNIPLIAIHIPKTAGSSVKEIFRAWFGDRLLFHYFNKRSSEMPPKYDLVAMHTKEQPIVIYGHFNRTRNFGIEHYYPKAEQFITILRDPFERVVSGYFYMRENRKDWIDQSRVPKDKLRDHILNTKGSMLHYFP
jgi:hypothetical protein